MRGKSFVSVALIVLLLVGFIPLMNDVSATPVKCASLADTYVTSGQWPWDNYGNLNIAYIGSGQYRAFIKYDLTGVSSVSNATAYFYCDAGSAGTVTAKLVTASWVETTITYENQPAVGSTIGTASWASTSSGVWRTIGVTSAVQYWLGAGSNYGIRLEYSADYHFRTRESIDNNLDPYMDVDPITAYPTTLTGVLSGYDLHLDDALYLYGNLAYTSNSTPLANKNINIAVHYANGSLVDSTIEVTNSNGDYNYYSTLEDFVVVDDYYILAWFSGTTTLLASNVINRSFDVGYPAYPTQIVGTSPYVTGLTIFNGNYYATVGGGTITAIGKLVHAGTSTGIASQNLSIEVLDTDRIVLAFTGAVITDGSGNWVYDDIALSITVPGRYYIDVWFDENYSSPVGWYLNSNVYELVIYAIGWDAIHSFTGNVSIDTPYWQTIHSFNGTVILIYVPLPVWTQIHTFTGIINIPTVTVLPDAYMLIMGIVWLLVIFIPPIVLNTVVERIGYIMGMLIILTSLGFAMQGFFMISFIGYIGIGLLLWKGDW